MVKNKKIACGLLLTAVLCTTALSASPGESQAHYVNRAAWYTVAEPTASLITGDSLVDVTQPRLINLLGQMTQEAQQVPITLTSEKNLSGALTWTVDQPQYLKVGMGIGSRELASGDVIGLSKGKPATVMMSVELTEQGLSAPQATTVDIQLTWKETLTGTFRVALPGAGNTAAQEAASVQLQTVEAFHPESPFPLKLTADRAAQVQLGVVSDTDILPFPEGTRFSLDQGSTWNRLCRQEKIPVNIPADEPLSMLLDLSHTELAQAQRITLSTGGTQVSLAAAPAPIYELSSRILTSESPIRVRLTNAWPTCDLDCGVEMLMAAEGAKAYVPVDLSAGQLIVSYFIEETGPELTLRVGNLLPQPGTYRLRLSWSQDGLCFQQSEVTFFVNYTEQTLSQQTGGAQP